MADDEPQRVVEAFYDAHGEKYLETYVEGVADDPRLHHLALLQERLPDGADVLDLGCGAGIPVTAALAARHRVLGVDLSAGQIARARRNVPAAGFRKADITALDLPAASFDAVTACYAFNHLPQGTQPAVLHAIARWLRPGGLLLAAFGTSGSPGAVWDFLGAEVYFAGHTAEDNRRHLADAGFTLLHDATPPRPDGETWQWVLAAAPAAA